MKRIAALLTAAACVLGYSATANAQVALRGEVGIAAPLNFPQADHFYPGIGGDLKLDIDLCRWFDMGPAVSGLVLPSQTSASREAGTAFGVGWGFRVKRPHDLGHWSDFSSISPWVDTDLQLITTGQPIGSTSGDLQRAALSVGIGAALPTSESRQLWVGPFARYVDVLENAHPGYYNQDAHVVIVGLSFEFGGRDQTHHAAPPPPPPVKVVENNPPPKSEPLPAPVPEEAPKFDQRIQFAFDSAVIRGSEKGALDDVAHLLLSGKYDATVEGYASSEGQLEHNKKLSLRRAQAVVDYLVGNGVAKDHLTAVGMGISNPVADNSTEEGRKKNRRVSFVVITLTKKDQ